MDFEDLEPKNKKLPPKDLSRWNIEDLEEYIAAMQAEIDRVRAEIDRKKGVAAAAEGLFKS